MTRKRPGNTKSKIIHRGGYNSAEDSRGRLKTPEEFNTALRKIGALAAARGNAKYLSTQKTPKPVANAVTLSV